MAKLDIILEHEIELSQNNDGPSSRRGLLDVESDDIAEIVQQALHLD